MTLQELIAYAQEDVWLSVHNAAALTYAIEAREEELPDDLLAAAQRLESAYKQGSLYALQLADLGNNSGGQAEFDAVANNLQKINDIEVKMAAIANDGEYATEIAAQQLIIRVLREQSAEDIDKLKHHLDEAREEIRAAYTAAEALLESYLRTLTTEE